MPMLKKKHMFFVEPQDSTFLREMCESLLSMGPQQKGRYGPLCCMVDHVGARALLALRPDLPVQLLQSMGEQALVSYVSCHCSNIKILRNVTIESIGRVVKQISSFHSYVSGCTQLYVIR